VILRWEQGRSTVDALLARGQLTRVAPNSELAESMLHQARAHLTSAALVVENDPTGAFVLAYDSARKTLAAILVNQGSARRRRRRAHRSLGRRPCSARPPLGGTFRPFSWMRPLRNHTEYPSPDYPVAQSVDVAEAIPAAAKMIDVATKVIGQMPTY
jgi:hypothetical protein